MPATFAHNNEAGGTMVYDASFASRMGLRDGNGNRVSKTVAGVTTLFLISEINPTGYAQVVAESFPGGTGNREESHSYVYGLDRISQRRVVFLNNQNITQVSFYIYDAPSASRMFLRDGHGSVRALTDPTGNITDAYDYDAFGNLIHTVTTQCLNSNTNAISTVALGAACPAGSTALPTFNEFLFAGEQFDADLHLYYNRARYLNTTTGRFWTMDTNQQDYQDFQEILDVTFGISSAAAGGALAGQLVNALAKYLPQVPSSPSAGSEVIEIGTKAAQGIQGAEAGVEEEVAEAVAEQAA